MNRNDKILGALDRSMRVLEIGPLSTPIAPKSEGWRTIVVDHTTRDALVEKYGSDPNVDTSRIEEVDVVWSDGPLHESVPRDWHGTFDACIASHALEHIPDPIGLLTSLERVLAPEGYVSLVIPDKRYCFDYYKPLSSVGELLEANARGASRHSRKARFDHEAYRVRADGEFAWSRRKITEIEFSSNLLNAKRGFDSPGTRPEDPYVDVHGWQFTPSSFVLVVLELAALDMIDFSVERSFPTEGCEFYVTLGRDEPCSRRRSCSGVASSCSRRPSMRFATRRSCSSARRRRHLAGRSPADVWSSMRNPSSRVAPAATCGTGSRGAGTR